ncbi:MULTISPECIES: LysR family transcriptional regulator [unclassified Ruegeria]|uniref:LysR family transcriptional regulator n=1 Tax=unclassified Ruegeria TaxID=2625375 RepID=UPI001AE1B7DA|nr:MULTISPECIES: LysR family transcriptional regulator [unclassified Ruegeria]
MDKFRALLVFSKVADLGGFAAAARNLNMSPPAVTRTISMLERDLGIRLFVRTTRSVMLTESGRRFLEDAKRILVDLEQAENAAVGTYSEPKGLLNLTSSVLFGKLFITPILADFLERYPKIEAQTLYVDRVVNLIDEGVDVGVRIGPLADSSLMAVRCGSVRQVVFAAPEYLERAGEPERPEDLNGHVLINSQPLSPSGQWQFDQLGKPKLVRVHPRVSMNTNDAVIEMALRGQGLARLLSYQIAPYLADGRLSAVLSDFEPAPAPVHIVHHEGRMVSAKVRAFVEFAASRLKREAALEY